MKVTIHKLFDYLLETTAQDPPECFIGFSLARSPKLKDFLPDLDPELSLDWNGKSFLGLPSLRQRVLDQAGLDLPLDSVLITAGAAATTWQEGLGRPTGTRIHRPSSSSPLNRGAPYMQYGAELARCLLPRLLNARLQTFNGLIAP